MGRFAAAWSAFWAILRSDDAAQRWLSAGAGAASPAADLASEGEATGVRPETPVRKKPDILADAVYTLVLMQREGRLVDFLREQIDGYTDAQVGAAARQIHDACRRVLDEVFGLVPIRDEDEGSQVAIGEEFDPRHLRIIGSASGSPPHAGILRHRGWRVTKVDFAQRHEGLDSSVVCPAEVEV